MLNLEAMDEDGDLEVGCLTTLSQLDVQVLAQENEGFHTCTLMQYSHVLGVSDYIVRFEMLSIHCTASCRELTTAHVNTNANTVQQALEALESPRSTDTGQGESIASPPATPPAARNISQDSARWANGIAPSGSPATPVGNDQSSTHSSPMGMGAQGRGMGDGSGAGAPMVHKHAPLCIKIDVEPTNKLNAGYSLMFNVEKVATGLRYGVEIKDRKTMLKVYHRCFGGPDAVDWLTQSALKAFMEKEKYDITQPPNERLRILARSAALLLGQRLLETEVFRQINKTKGNQNVFEDPNALFRFREDEKAGPVLNTRRVWNCRARPPIVVAADLVHKAMGLHLSVASLPPDDSWSEWMAFLQVAEELQMVDISLLFRRAEVAFFLNLHNALMLHTHMYRATGPGEHLRSMKSRLLKLHQYRVGGQFYHMETMQQRLLKSKVGSRGAGGLVEPRLHFALSLGCVSSPDVRVYTVGEYFWRRWEIEIERRCLAAALPCGRTRMGSCSSVACLQSYQH